MDNRPVSIPAAVLIGSILISLSILYTGGAFSKFSLKGNSTAQTANATPAPTSTAAPVVPVTVGNLPVMGNPNAKVTIVEFADFQCPFCDAVTGLQPSGPVMSSLTKQDPNWKPYIPGIINDYVKTGKAKLYYRDFSFLGQESNDAANAARCANEQGKFWEYHDKLFTIQGPENSGTFSKDKLKQYAADLGLDANKFNNCVDADKYAKDVQADTNAGRQSGVNGTPALFINGKQFPGGAVSYDLVKPEIENALK